MSKRFLHLVLAFVMLVMAGCGGGAPSEAPVTAPADGKQYPLTVTDSAGREVTIAAAPQRVLSFAPSHTEVVFALGAGDLLVGRTDYCDYPAEAAEVPSVGGIMQPEYERILATKPDLVLMIGGSEAMRDQLTNEHKLTVLQIQPEDLAQTYEAIDLIGRVLNRQEAADQVVADMKAKIASVEAQVASVSEEQRPKVFYEMWNDPLMTAGPRTFISDLIQKAGGVNIADDAQDQWPVYPLEQVAKHNPDLIFTEVQETYEVMKAQKRDGWENIKAVREGNVVLIEDLNLIVRPGPRLALGLEWMASVLHPELVAR